MIVNYRAPREYISIEELQEASALLGLEEGVISDIKDSILKAIANIGNKFGVRLIDSEVVGKVSKVDEEFKKNGLSARILNPIQSILHPLTEKTCRSKIFQNKVSKYNIDPEKSMRALISSTVMFYACVFVQLIFKMLLGERLVMQLIAPITEEYAKKIAADNGYILEFNIIFNILEFTGYYRKLRADGYPIPVIIIARLLSVAMHSTTAIIHYISHNTKLLEKLGIDTSDPNKLKKCAFIGEMIGTVIHMLWNCAAVVQQDYMQAHPEARPSYMN